MLSRKFSQKRIIYAKLLDDVEINSWKEYTFFVNIYNRDLKIADN